MSLRTLTLATILLLSTFARAENQIHRSKESRCSELQSVLQANGSIRIKSLLGYYTLYSTDNKCLSYEKVSKYSVKTLDNKKCDLGYGCMPEFPAGGDGG